MVKILSTSHKVKKGEGLGWLTAVSYLAPAFESGQNLCPWHTTVYAASCLGHSAGRLSFESSRLARIDRARLFLLSRERFLARLRCELEDHVLDAARRGLNPAVRLNGSSDIPWESVSPELFELFPRVQFYDYTKSVKRMLSFLEGDLPVNYSLTFSRSEQALSWKEAHEVLSRCGNVAVVFDEIPERFQGYPVLDGESHDLRFLDERGCIVGLRAKGAALGDQDGFVVRLRSRVAA